MLPATATLGPTLPEPRLPSYEGIQVAPVMLLLPGRLRADDFGGDR